MLTDGLFKEKNVWGKHISQCNSFLGGHILYEDVRAEGWITARWKWIASWMNSQCYFMGFHLFNFALLQGYTLHSLTRGPCLQLLMYISVQRKRYVLQKWSNCSKGALCTLHGVTKMCMPLNALLGPLKLWIFLHFQGVFKITFSTNWS